jgi:uncharacterized protein involved in exopolysaccharide biosynthesis
VMESNQMNQPPHDNYADDEIDLRELFGILWAEKVVILSITAFFAVASLIYALLQADIYRAETVLAAADSRGSTGGLSAQLGGAAALLGVNAGTGGGDSINTALATLRSRQFLGRFIKENGLLVPLFASSWDGSIQQSVIDGDVYNAETGEWLLENGTPTEMIAVRALGSILKAEGPDRTGLVTVAIEWPNPVEAATWANQLVFDLNQEIRARDVREATDAIAYLQKQLSSTPLVEMQRVFYQLIESQTRIVMLADVRSEYVLRVIDPAVVPDQKFAPSRALICVIGTMAGGMFALMLVFVRRLFLTKPMSIQNPK